MFRRPHRPDLGPAESFQRLDNTSGETLYEAEADLRNCFYQCEMESWMAPYFCFDFCVDQVWCAENGIALDVDGNHIQPDENYYVCLSVLPMGFSWSFWIVQEMVVGLCQEAATPSRK